MSIREIIAAICIFIGLFVFLCSILGIYRFKYAMNRMHAAALGDTMGIFFVVLGLLILGQDIYARPAGRSASRCWPVWCAVRPR